ncbi:1-(5-phosphoribosyl)-5-[(5-phosphoribosylamino)methylideneamino]imidazole-4-carboxamide isomerase [Balneolaceae bacterium ANBcel3]|nr:1-(5-phosphoribosyl)-5-[(5-phosphoribosylamino)methylideneamino]imidazole-4-carboxamide isomerase [Balneolaceae bacterium ANBcel3]
MQVIPAIDLLNGKVVRLKKGDYNEVTVYSDDPVSFVKKFKDAGFTHIHIVDLNGAREGRFMNLPIIESIIQETGISVQSGGGIRSREDIETLLDAGISRIVSSSLAVQRPMEWKAAIDSFGGDTCILGLDIKDGKMAYGGWERISDESAIDFLGEMVRLGVRTILCTDISRDGMLSGVNSGLYSNISERFPQVNIIASGGVADVDDLKQLAIEGMYGVVVGRAYYEKKITLEEMISFHEKTNS